MRFETIKITGGQADLPDPRVSPAQVPAAALKTTPPTLTGTDQAPGTLMLTLEGTAGQTVTVQQYALDEGQSDPSLADDPNAGAALRQFYAVAGAVLVTVGTVSTSVATPGRVYYRLTSAPAADAKLKIGFS